MSPEHAREWVSKAEADRRAAQRALGDARRRRDQAEIACFHAQQCAEKYLKAVLIKAGRRAPRTHDLVALALESQDLGLDPRLQDLRRLNEYAVEVRYPGASASLGDARTAFNAMERVARLCREFLG